MRMHSCENGLLPVAERTAWKSSRVAIGYGLVFLLLSWVFPPHVAEVGGGVALNQDGAGFRILFSPSGNWTDGRTFVVDGKILLVIDLAIVVATTIAVYFLKMMERASLPSERRRLRREAIVVAIGGCGLVAAWLFPPWTVTNEGIRQDDHRGAGFHYVFHPPEVWSDQREFGIDWKVLAIINLGVFLAMTAAFVSIQSEVD